MIRSNVLLALLCAFSARTGGSHSPANRPPVECPLPNGRGTILVVEDEPAIRDLLRLHLGLAQFDVREARVEAVLQQAAAVWRGNPIVRSPVHDRRLRAT